MIKFLLATLTLTAAFAHAGDTYLECRVTAFNNRTLDGKVKKSGYSSIARNILGELDEKSEKKTLKISKAIEVSKEQTLFLTISLNLETGQVGGGITNSISGDAPSLEVSRLGAWVKMEDRVNSFSLGSPAKGTIAEGFLEDRDNKELVDFNSIDVLCSYAVAKTLD
jgi:hypothetical protein